MDEQLSLQQLAQFTGEPEDRLRDWEARGILKASIDGHFELDEVERVRLVQLMLRRGIDVEVIAERRSAGYLDWMDTFAFKENPVPSTRWRRRPRSSA